MTFMQTHFVDVYMHFKNVLKNWNYIYVRMNIVYNKYVLLTKYLQGVLKCWVQNMSSGAQSAVSKHILKVNIENSKFVDIKSNIFLVFT